MATTSLKKAYLIALDASISSREYVLNQDTILLGRDGNRCEVVAAGITISRKHAEIVRSTSEYFAINDLRSTNGVYVNGLKIETSTVLKDGDLIGLGAADEHHFCFQSKSRKHVSWTANLPEKDLWSIGRSADNDISLPFESVVSSHHGVLRNRNGVLEIRDTDSLNGIWVNGFRVRRAKLTPSDTIVVGSTYFRFSVNNNGTLNVDRRECGDDIQLDCVAVNYTVTTKEKKQKSILDDITLSIKPGEFVGILGPSGAGKSTLLKTLNGYIQPTSGAVLLNETSLHHAYDMFRNAIGYVPQDDILHQELTVEKSLEYVAKLRLPSDLTKEQRSNLVDSTLEALGLNHVRNQTIEQLSGGQRKRVSIGAELLTKPSVLFLDEPTSGLDPSVEDKIMRHFKKMAQNGTTILITTHILYSLHLLDRVVILSQGKLVFFGPPEDAMEFFRPSERPLNSPMEIFELLEHPVATTPDQTIDYTIDHRSEIAEHYNELYQNSPLYSQNIAEHQPKSAKKIMEADTQFVQQKAKPLLVKLLTLFSFSYFKALLPLRDTLPLTSRHIRLRVSSLNRVFFYALIPLLLALVTLSQSVPGLPIEKDIIEQKSVLAKQLSSMTVRDTHLMKKVLTPDSHDSSQQLSEVIYALKSEGVQNLPVPMSILVMCVMTGVFLGTICTCLEISTEKSVYKRERMSSLRIADYIIAKLPLVFVITLLQCCLFLALLHLNPSLMETKIYYAAPTMIAVAWSSACLGLFISTIDPTQGQLSVIFAIAAVLPQLLLSGGLGPDFYAGMSTMGQIVANCIPSRWGLEMMLTAIYQNITPPSTGWISVFISKSMGFSYGAQVISKGMGILACQGLCWLLLSALVLKRRDKSRV